MSPTKINDISQLNLKTKQIALNASGIELFFNFADILNDKEKLYINATPLLKEVKGPNAELKEYFKLKQTRATIEALERFYSTRDDSPVLDKGFYYAKAGRYGGTWIHRRLFLNFARWLSPDFEVICDHLLEQVFEYAEELKPSRQALRKLQAPLNDQIKISLVDTGIKNDKAYMQFNKMIKLMVGAPDDRDTYSVHQLNTATKIVEEYRAMIKYGKMTSLKAMNDILRESELNLAWTPNQKKLEGE